jgi:hypothetical protein
MTTLEKEDEQSAPMPGTVDAATQSTAPMLEYKELPTAAYHTLQSYFPSLWVHIYKNLNPILSTVLYTALTSHRVYSWPWLFYNFLSGFLSTSIYLAISPRDHNYISIRHNKIYIPLQHTIVYAGLDGWSSIGYDWFVGLEIAFFFGHVVDIM